MCVSVGLDVNLNSPACPRVVSVHLTVRSIKLGKHQFGKTSIPKILQYVPLLEAFDTGESKKVNVADLALPNAPNLRSLRIGWAASFDDDDGRNLLAFAHHFHHIFFDKEYVLDAHSSTCHY